jgi:glutamate synthase (NADPH/NADH) small chain
VGIIGSGPAGLVAAEELRLRGHAVTIYERQDRAGGLLLYGIPNFKLDNTIVKRRIARLEEAGVRFELGVEVGHDRSIEELQQEHDALLIATGVYSPRELKVAGRDHPNVIRALDFLIAENRRELGDALPAADSDRLSAAGKDVVVVGGGDTAMDCVRTAVRQQANSVTCLYRRDRANMPGSAREVAHAEEEGVTFRWLAQPIAFVGDERVRAVRAQRMRLAAPDAGGRQTVRPTDEEPFELAADLVIEALGFTPEPLAQRFSCPELACRPDGTLIVGNDLQTRVPGVFAAGDIARGASLVVWAVVDGRQVATAIDRYLGQPQQKEQQVAAGGFR